MLCLSFQRPSRECPDSSPPHLWLSLVSTLPLHSHTPNHFIRWKVLQLFIQASTSYCGQGLMTQRALTLTFPPYSAHTEKHLISPTFIIYPRVSKIWPTGQSQAATHCENKAYCPQPWPLTRASPLLLSHQHRAENCDMDHGSLKDESIYFWSFTKKLADLYSPNIYPSKLLSGSPKITGVYGCQTILQEDSSVQHKIMANPCYQGPGVLPRKE